MEVERARVTRILSDMKKEQGDLNAAADILCELQVETFGSMERREKTEFILEQVALCIEKGDWTQAGILSRKISTKFFARKPKKTPEQIEKDKKEREEKEKNRSMDDPPLEKEDDVTDLKLRYYEQQITLAKHEDKYLDACKHYRQVLDTESVEENPEQLHAVRNVLSKPQDPSSNIHRSSKELSTTSSSPRTTTNNPISSTASTPTPATPSSLASSNSSKHSPFLNSCDGPSFPSDLALTFALLTSSPLRPHLQIKKIRKPTPAGKIYANVSLSTMFGS